MEAMLVLVARARDMRRVKKVVQLRLFPRSDLFFRDIENMHWSVEGKKVVKHQCNNKASSLMF